MQLKPEQRGQLQKALLSAFPTLHELHKMVEFELEVKWEEINSDHGLDDCILNLITKMRARSQLRVLISAALAQNPTNESLRAFADQLGFTPVGAAPDTIEAPKRGKIGILIDLSHRQVEWNRSSIFKAADGSGALIRMIQPSPKEPSWDLRELTDPRQFSAKNLHAWSGVLLGMPFHSLIDETTRQAIVSWVRQGGRLVLLGFELGERHHETNLNELAAEFGLRFNSEMVAPKGWLPPNKPYNQPINFGNLASDHPLMDKIKQLCFWNLCTLTVEPGADVVLTVRDNAIARLKKDDVSYTREGWLVGGYQEFEVINDVGWVPIIAEAPKGLVGEGKVLAIATWQLFGANYSVPTGFDNVRFVANLFNWFGSS